MADPVTSAGTAPPGFRPAEPFRMVVEEGKIHEFARATRSACPEHLRPGDPVSPVTFLASHRLWMGEENSAWRGVQRDFRYVLHGEEEFVFHGPPPQAGTVLTARQVIQRQYAKQGRRGGTMTFTDLVTRFWPEEGHEDRPLVEERTVTISTEPTAPADSSGTGSTGSAKPPVPVSEEASAPVVFDHREPPYTVTDFVRYQGASGDFNPIHHDTSFAQASGRPGPFAVGMLAAAIAANFATHELGVSAVRRFRVRWSDVAWPGDALRYRAVGTEGGGLRIDVTRPDGRPHVTAHADTVL